MSVVPETGVLAVLTTVPDAAVGERLGRALVEEHLAACANIVPGVVSVYWWEGSLQRSGEALVILKTTEDRLAELEARAVQLHPYDVPEVLALPVGAGHAPYLEWVHREVGMG
jgi:periplasmic divalent cation tolerance protein